jgi:hypothetical protein
MSHYLSRERTEDLAFARLSDEQRREYFKAYRKTGDTESALTAVAGTGWKKRQLSADVPRPTRAKA